MKRILPVIIVLFVVFYSCKKAFDEQQEKVSEGFSIETVKKHYRDLMKDKYPKDLTATGHKVLLSMSDRKQQEVLWSRAYQSVYGIINYIEVPFIATDKRVTLYNFPADKVKLKPDESVARYSVQKLVFYQDNSGTIQQRVVTYIPDKEYLIRRKNEVILNGIKKMQSDFKGYMEYSDWEGNITSILRIVNGKVVRRYRVSASTGSKQQALSSSDRARRTEAMVCDNYCDPIYNETCVSVEDSEGNLISGPECTYELEDPNCTVYCYDDGTGGDPCPSGDCGSSGGGGGVDGGGGSSSGLIIDRDISVATNPKVNCILNALEGKSSSGNIQTKYDDLLNSFRDGNTWNLTYKLGSPVDENGNPVHGQTHYAGNNDFDIIYNVGQTDVNSSVIGKTFIHEAFHAYLEQKALETWGSLNPTQWKNDTQNLTLNELFNYIEVTKSKSLEDISHNFMADNLDEMIPALKEFIDPSNTLNLPADAYKGLMLQGLQGSKYYQDNILNSTETRDYNGVSRSLADYYNQISGQVSSLTLNCP